MVFAYSIDGLCKRRALYSALTHLTSGGFDFVCCFQVQFERMSDNETANAGDMEQLTGTQFELVGYLLLYIASLSRLTLYRFLIPIYTPIDVGIH